MNINEEKNHLYSMMREVTEERRRLTDIYYGLKERLDYLHSLEQRGLEDLTIQGYVNLHNEINAKMAVENIKRETEHIINKIQEEKKEDNIIEEKISKHEIAEQKYKDNKYRQGKYLDVSKVHSEIIDILKEEGIPVKTSNIYEKLIKKGISVTKHNLTNNILPRLFKENNKIQKPTFGFYQYKL